MLAVDLRKGTQWLFEKLLIYLFGCVDLSCSLRDLSHVACKLWFVACEILFPDQESNWGPLHWEHRVLSTGPPGKSRSNFWPSFFYSFTFHSSLQTQHQFASISCSSLHDQTIFWVTQEQSFFSAFLLLSLELLHPLSLPLVMVLAFFSLSPSQTLKSTVSCSLVAQSCPTLCEPKDCSMPGLPVPHHLPEFAQIHDHWCCLPISSSDVLFSFCFQSFPASGSFPRSQLFASGGQSTGASASASVFPMNITFPKTCLFFCFLSVKSISIDLAVQLSQNPGIYPQFLSKYSLNFPL